MSFIKFWDWRRLQYVEEPYCLWVMLSEIRSDKYELVGTTKLKLQIY
jgi:hypothetical protein